MLDLSKIHHYLSLGKRKGGGALSDAFDHFNVKVYILVAVFLNLLSWIAVLFMVSRVEEELIVLHYSVGFGADLVGSVYQLLVVPGLGLLILFVNLFLLFILRYSKDFNFFSHLFLATALAVNLFLLISLGPIYLINFR